MRIDFTIFMVVLLNPLLSFCFNLKHVRFLTPVLKRCISTAKKQRLDRIVSNRGAGSRSEVAILLKKGAVCVDNVVTRSGSALYPINANITVRGKPLVSPIKV